MIALFLFSQNHIDILKCAKCPSGISQIQTTNACLLYTSHFLSDQLNCLDHAIFYPDFNNLISRNFHLGIILIFIVEHCYFRHIPDFIVGRNSRLTAYLSQSSRLQLVSWKKPFLYSSGLSPRSFHES